MHVVANSGHERFVYHGYRLPVVWIKLIQRVFITHRETVAVISMSQVTAALRRRFSI